MSRSRSILNMALIFMLFAAPVYASQNLNDGVQDIVRQVTNSLEKKGKNKIAIMEFSELDGSVSNFGRYLSEKMITVMFRTQKFEVIERRQLNNALEELKFSSTGAINPSSIKELGKTLGVDAIAIGSVSDLGKNVEINARLIESETGKIFAVASTIMLKDETISSLMGSAVRLPALEVQDVPKVSRRFTDKKPEPRESYTAVVTNKKGVKSVVQNIKGVQGRNWGAHRLYTTIPISYKGSSSEIPFNEVFSIERLPVADKLWTLTRYDGKVFEVESSVLGSVTGMSDQGKFHLYWRDVSKIEFLNE